MAINSHLLQSGQKNISFGQKLNKKLGQRWLKRSQQKFAFYRFGLNSFYMGVSSRFPITKKGNFLPKKCKDYKKILKLYMTCFCPNQ